MMKIFHLLIRFQSIKSKEVRFRKLNFRSKRYIHDFFWFQIECTCAHARKSIIIMRKMIMHYSTQSSNYNPSYIISLFTFILK